VCVVLRWPGDGDKVVWGVFAGSADTSARDAARRELGIRERGAWTVWDSYATERGDIYTLHDSPVQP
jgi:hypothetical protein